MKKKDVEFLEYKYYIYKDYTKATKSSEINHAKGLVIYKQSKVVKTRKQIDSKRLTEALLKLLNNIDFEELKTKDVKQIILVFLRKGMYSISVKENIGPSIPIKIINFDNDGNIIND